MTPTEIIKKAMEDGVSLTLSPAGSIKASGNQASVSRWRPLLRQYKPELVALLLQDSPARAWLIRFTDGKTTQVVCAPPATQAEIRACYPHILTAEPCQPTQQTSSTTLSAAEEHAIKAWLSRIGETGPTVIQDVMDQCRNDVNAKTYFIHQAQRDEQSRMTDPEHKPDSTKKGDKHASH